MAEQSTIEIELKFPLLNAAELEKKLNITSEFKYSTTQIDTYYNAPHRNFLAIPERVKEYLRLRQSNNKFSICYKNFHPKDTVESTHCDEYECTVSSYTHMELLLKALNFEPIVTVKKCRKVWTSGDIEISIDTLDDLGEFIELEYKGSLTDVLSVREHLSSFLKTIGAETGIIDERGYPYLLMKKKGLL